MKFGCNESIAAILSSAIQSFSQKHPRALLQAVPVRSATSLNAPGLELLDLRARQYDFALGHFITPLTDDYLIDDLDIEILFHDHLLVATGKHSPWARRRNIDLSDLLDAPWILGETPNSWNYSVVSEAFRNRGLAMPKIVLLTFSVHLRTNMITSGHFITTFPTSLLRFHPDRRSFKVLPIALPTQPWSVGIARLKNRTLSPVVEGFIAHLRDFTMPLRLGRQCVKLSARDHGQSRPPNAKP